MKANFPELRSARRILRSPAREEEAYGGTFDPELPFTREHAEAAIRLIEEQEYAWVIDAGRFIGHVRFHSVDRHDKRAALAIGIDDPAYPAAALGVAALLEAPGRYAGKTVATVLCGSNVAPKDFDAWVKKS